MERKHESVTATELARNMASVIDRVRYTGKSLYITKGSQTIAELSPPPKAGFPAEGLNDFLASLPKLGDDAQQMSDDLRMVRDNASLPESPWD